MSKFFKGASNLAELGWKIVPLRDRDKKPRLDKWQENASDDEEQLAEWWGKWPNANVGVQLGPRSGIIDLECDSEKGEEDLLRLFEEPPICPTFKAHRGKHRLFKWHRRDSDGALATACALCCLRDD